MKAGEIPQGLIVVYSGQCLAVLERIKKRAFEVYNKFSKLTAKEIKDHFKVSSIERQKVKSHRVFDLDVTKRSGTRAERVVYYKSFSVFQKIMPTKFFGFRTILPQENVEYRQRKSENKGLEANLNIIADSHCVVLLIDRQVISFLEEDIQEIIFNREISLDEPDRPFSLRECRSRVEEEKRWERYKYGFCEKTLKNLYLNRQKMLQ